MILKKKHNEFMCIILYNINNLVIWHMSEKVEKLFIHIFAKIAEYFREILRQKW